MSEVNKIFEGDCIRGMQSWGGASGSNSYRSAL